MTAKANTNLATLGAQSAVATSAGQWAGRVLSGLPALFLLMDAGMKLFKAQASVTATVQLGYPESAIAGIGVILLASTLLYVVPRTAILGAILLTGCLGGAAASKVRVQAGWFAVLFPVLLGMLLWGGLWLRDRRIRELLPNTIGNSS
jgi:hypothetical protein